VIVQRGANEHSMAPCRRAAGIGHSSMLRRRISASFFFSNTGKKTKKDGRDQQRGAQKKNGGAGGGGGGEKRGGNPTPTQPPTTRQMSPSEQGRGGSGPAVARAGREPERFGYRKWPSDELAYASASILARRLLNYAERGSACQEAMVDAAIDEGVASGRSLRWSKSGSQTRSMREGKLIDGYALQQAPIRPVEWGPRRLVRNLATATVG